MVVLDRGAGVARGVLPVDVREGVVGDGVGVGDGHQGGDVNLGRVSPLEPVVFESGEDVVVADDQPRVAPVDGDPHLALAHEVVGDGHVAGCVPILAPPRGRRVERLDEALVGVCDVAVRERKAPDGHAGVAHQVEP